MLDLFNLNNNFDPNHHFNPIEEVDENKSDILATTDPYEYKGGLGMEASKNINGNTGF